MHRLIAFEVGPIRPPSEARSLLIRITRNCQWNRCSFCPVYKNREFSVRSVDEIISDIDLLGKHISNIRAAFSTPLEMTSDKAWLLMQRVEPMELAAFDYALKWFTDGMQSVFLQDADALVIGAKNLAIILNHLRNRFPWVERITTYSRSSTIIKVGEDSLKELKDAGLNRVHVGLESGSDEVLKIVKKGASKAMHIKAGIMIKSANLELSEYFMPSLGGKRLSEVHAKESADALNQINPDFIRLRPLALTDRAPLYSDFESGKFVKCNDIDIAQELIMFIEALEGINSMVVSDHILNLFADLEGKLPDGKKHMLSILRTFLDMDSDKQNLYRIGRRLGLLNSLKDMDDARKMDKVMQIAVGEGISSETIDTIIDRLMERFI